MHLIIKISFVTFFLISIGCKNRSNKRFPEITLSETLFTIDDSSWHIELPVSSVYQGGIYSYDTVSNLVIFFNGERKIILIDISNKKIVCEYALDQNYLYTNVRIKKKIGSYSFKSNLISLLRLIFLIVVVKMLLIVLHSKILFIRM
jgi:hypothetical protein